MCINCMLCYAACPIYGLDPKFLGPAAIALAQRYNLDNRDEGPPKRMEVLSEHEGIWGCTFVGECTKVCPKHVDPAGAIQRYKLTRGAGVDEVVLPAKGGVMSEHASIYTDYHPRWLRRHVSTYWWLEKGSYFAFILRESELHLRRVVRRLPPAARECRRAGRGAATSSSSPGRRAGGAGRERRQRSCSWSFTPSRSSTRRRRRWWCTSAGKRVPGTLVLMGHYVAWAVASVVVAWLLLGA